MTAINSTDTTDKAPLVVDHMAVCNAIDGYLTLLSTRDTSDIEQDEAYEEFAAAAVGLARLAVAWQGYRKGPMRDEGRTWLPPSHTVEELRAKLNILLTEPETPDDSLGFSANTLHGLVWAIQQGIAAYTLPGEEEQTEEAGMALHRLTWMAVSLQEAAFAASGQINQRLYALKRAAGEYPFNRPTPGARTPVNQDLVDRVAKAMEAVEGVEGVGTHKE